MNPHLKSFCLLGVALAFWNCDESSVSAAVQDATQGSSIESSSDNADIAMSSENLTESSSSATFAAISSAENAISSGVVDVSSSSEAASSEKNAASSSSVISEKSSSSTIRDASSSSVAAKVSSSSAATKVSSSSVAPTAKSSSSVTPSSSSVTPKAESSSSRTSVKRSVGCGKSLGSIKSGFAKITSSGKSRDYAIDIPTNYDPNKPYRLFYTSHWFGGSAKDVANGSVSNGGADWAYFGLRKVANDAGEPAIFIAPSMNGSTWDLGGNGADHKLFSDLLNYAKTNLCIDESRVFATGFSFGAMMSYSLSLTHQDEIRAVATLAAVNYVGNANSPWIPYPADSKKKIAYLGITGMSDGTCPFIGNKDKKLGGIYAAMLHAEDNGCTVPADPNSISKTYAGSKSHVVYDFKNCAEGYPVRYITFDGGHIAAPTDGQTNDDGKRTWAPKAMWEFFTQF